MSGTGYPTPGPLTVRYLKGAKRRRYGHLVVANLYGDGRDIVAHVRGRDDAIARANARRFAASPEMREALGGVKILLETRLREYRQEPWAQRVLAAIEKADQGEVSNTQ